MAIYAGIERLRRKNLEKKNQAESDLLASDPIGWIDRHFPNGMPELPKDNGPGKTDDPGV